MPPARAVSRSKRHCPAAVLPGRRPRRLRRTIPAIKKVILSPDQIIAAHKQIADEFGNQADRVVSEARKRRKEQAQERPANERQQQVREAVTFVARDKGFEREAVVDERALYVNALRRGMGEMTYPEVRASFEARVTSGEFKEVPIAVTNEAGAGSPPRRPSRPK